MSAEPPEQHDSSLERLQTARLTCTRITPDDAAELTAVLIDERVRRTLFPHRGAPTAAEIDEHITEKNAHWDRHGFGVYTLRDRATGEFVGRAGIQHTRSTGADEIELLWVVAPARWGQGLATEFAQAAVEIAFEGLALDDVIAFTMTTNLASRRVMEKAALSYERDFEHVGLPHALYRRTRC